MSQHLYGIHDPSSDWAALIRDAGMTGWAVISEEIGDDPANYSGQDYSWLASYGVTPIVRLNYSHTGNGTLPLPDRYAQFAARCANFVVASDGCDHWVIANEPNLAGERFNGIPILPHQYADCFAKCRHAIKQRGTHHQVIPAAVAPYNVDTGWCMDYWAEMLALIAMTAGDGGADGLAIHCYSRGGDPASIWSEAKMDAPYQQWHNGFRAYRDFLALVPAVMLALPVYITETDQLDPWVDVNSGWVVNAYDEIDSWNLQNEQGIHCLALYRWENYDQWGFKDKRGVVDDFRAALAYGYQTPADGFDPPGGEAQPEPPIEPEFPPDDDYLEEWDARLDVRGTVLGVVETMPGDAHVHHVTAGQWYNEQEAQGRVNVFVTVLDERGELAVGVPVRWWNGGEEVKPTEVKYDPFLGRHYSLDFAMYSTAPAYSLMIDDGQPSDLVSGLGLGSIEQPHYAIHTAYSFTFQRFAVTSSLPPIPPLPPDEMGALVWPVAGVITQEFGEPPAQFGQQGHGGIDIACPMGAPVVAIADGEVMYTGWDDAYGNYIRIFHPSIHSHSFLAHLSSIGCYVGDGVSQGEVIGHAGSTGNSTGPHVHFELRGGDRDAYVIVTYGYSQGRYNPMDAYLVTGSPLIPGAGL